MPIPNEIKGKVVAISKVWDNDHYDYRCSPIVALPDGSFKNPGCSYGITENDQPDAPKEVIQAYENYLQALRDQAAKDRAIYEAKRQAKIPAKGKKILVFKGRKIPKGTTGMCFWYGTTPYGYSVGLEYTNQKGIVVREFTSADNVEVIQDHKEVKEVLHNQFEEVLRSRA